MTIAAQYHNAEKTAVTATIDGVEFLFIPLDVDSDISDKIKAWIADGNAPSPYAPPPED